MTPKLKALALAISGVLAAHNARANGTDPVIVAGEAGFVTQGKLLSITNSPGAIIHWQGFSIGTGETMRFVQQSAASSVLNRVVGPDPSSIFGTLSSNGKVFLINPAGILFGSDSHVDVASLVASTLNLSNDDFRAGLLNFRVDTLAGKVDNQGSITTPTGGNVYLIGTKVSNSGVIRSPQGDVILAAGTSVKIFDSSTPGLRVELNAEDSTAENLGKIIAQSGQVGIYAAALNNSGTINADQVVRDERGKIVLRASHDVSLTADSVLSASGGQGGGITVQSESGTLLANGNIAATSTAATASGGDIALLGERVGLLEVSINASGPAGGGTVLVGGSRQGSNALVQNAHNTYVGPGASIKADALVAGDGGNVVVWSDDFTRFTGFISARGGSLSGQGGNVETSGKLNLEVPGGNVNTSASHGAAGSWLLDPSNVDITTGATTGSFAGEIFSPNQDAAIVNAGTISTALETGNVNITTTNAGGAQTGTITVSAPITRSTGAGITTLTLTPGQVTGGTITIAAGGNISGSTGSPLNVTLAAAGVGSTVAVGAPVTTFGGAFSSTGTTFTNLAGPIDTGGGKITINQTTGAATVTIASPLISGGGNISIAGGSTFTDTSTINAGSGTVTLRGSSDTLAIGIGSTTGTFNITQAQLANITTTGGLFIGHSSDTAAIHIATNEVVDFGSKNVTILQASGGMTIEGSSVNGSGTMSFNAGTGFFLNNSQIVTNGAVNITADQVTLNADIAGSGKLTIAPVTAGMAITVGTAPKRIDFGGTSFITTAVTSNNLRTLKIGSTANTGGITVVGAFNTGSPMLELVNSGPMTINAGATVTAGGIVLAGSNFINNGGAAALVVPGDSSWLVYSTSPALDTFGGLLSGSHALWGKTYASNPPASITDLTSHYLFSQVPQLTVSVTGGNISKTYGTDLSGSAPAVVVTGLVNAATYGNVFLQDAYTGTAAATSTGFAATAPVNGGTTYSVSAQANITEPAGYAASIFNNVALTVTPKVVSLSGSRSYNGSANILAGVLSTGTLVGTETLSLSGTGTVANKNVGAGKTLTLGSLALADGTNGGLAANYTLSGGTDTVSITTAPLTLSTSNVSRVYNGDLTALGTAVVSSGTLFSGDSLSGGSFAFTDKNVGSANKTVTTAGVTVNDGNSGSNYAVSYAANTTSTISPYVVSLSGTRLYNGSSNIAASVLATNSLVGTETLTLSGTGTTVDKNVGNSKTLTLGSLALGDGSNGGIASNYTLSGGTATVSITTAPLTLSTSNVSRVYNGDLTAAGTAVVSSGTLFSGDSLSGGSFAFTDKNVGSGNKTVTTSGVTVTDGNSGSNYTVSYAANNASTISPYVVSLNGTRVYDGSANILASVLGTGALVGTETLSLSGAGTVANKNIGVGKTLTLGSLALGDGSNGGLAANYTLTGGTDSVSITTAPLTLSTSNVSRVYNGDLTAAGTAVVSSGTLFSGDTLSGGSFAFTDKNVGSGNKTVTTSGVTVTDGNSGSNYTGSRPAAV